MLRRGAKLGAGDEGAYAQKLQSLGDYLQPVVLNPKLVPAIRDVLWRSGIRQPSDPGRPACHLFGPSAHRPRGDRVVVSQTRRPAS